MHAVRGSTMSSSLHVWRQLSCHWPCTQEGLAIPPLDSDRKWAWRKQHFMGTVSTRAAAEAYLAALDATFKEVLPKLGADGKDFSMWDTINECALPRFPCSHALCLGFFKLYGHAQQATSLQSTWAYIEIDLAYSAS